MSTQNSHLREVCRRTWGQHGITGFMGDIQVARRVKADLEEMRKHGFGPPLVITNALVVFDYITEVLDLLGEFLECDDPELAQEMYDLCLFWFDHKDQIREIYNMQ